MRRVRRCQGDVGLEFAPADDFVREPRHRIVDAALSIFMTRALNTPQSGGTFVKSVLPHPVQLQLTSDERIIELVVFLFQALLQAPIEFILTHDLVSASGPSFGPLSSFSTSAASAGNVLRLDLQHHHRRLKASSTLD